jgi:hypothetical protein
LGSELAQHALTIATYVKEVQKPDALRREGFHEAEMEQLRFRLFSTAPLYPDLEVRLLAHSLQISQQNLPPQDPFARLLAKLGQPMAAAELLIAGTKLTEVSVRKKLIEGGEQAVAQSTDPLLVFARGLVPLLEQLEAWHKSKVLSVLTPAAEEIAQARFAVYGRKIYPDATFTLRLSLGQIAGYPMNGTLAPYRTTLYGLYDRALGFDQRGEWRLTHRFEKYKKSLTLSTPVNFACSCDTTGGNSGSPVFNRRAELVGVVFDGNIEGLSGRFVYEGTRNRTLAVHAAYLIEALDKLYGAKALADEILARK